MQDKAVAIDHFPGDFARQTEPSAAPGLWRKAWRRGARAISQFAARTARGEERLWKVWWLAGLLMAAAAVLLVMGAEAARYAENSRNDWGDLLDMVRFLVYLAWCRYAWRCAGNVTFRLWTPLARLALAGGLVFMAAL